MENPIKMDDLGGKPTIFVLFISIYLGFIHAHTIHVWYISLHLP